MGYLICETSREEREQIVAESLGNLNGYCDGCIEEGKRIYKVLLWLEPDCISVHQIKNFK